jgi:AbrB family looped-hinge helix DNA binding protein
VVIPKALRDSAGLKAGAKLRVECLDGKIEIEAVSEGVQWVRKGTLMVAVPPAGTPKMTVAEVNRIAREIRNERERRIWPPHEGREDKA